MNQTMAGWRLTGMDKRSLSERDICTKFILPAVKRAGWDEMVQVRDEAGFTKGRIIVRGKLAGAARPSAPTPKCALFILHPSSRAPF